jgi:hypothetical protein
MLPKEWVESNRLFNEFGSNGKQKAHIPGDRAQVLPEGRPSEKTDEYTGWL